MKKKTYIESEVDKFLEKYEDKNIYTSYGDGDDKNKFNTEKIIKSLKKFHNKLINLSEFKEEYNKFMDNVKNFEDYKSEKKLGSVSTNQKKKKKMIRHVKGLEDIADLYNIKSGSDTSEKGEVLTNKQMLNRLPILLAQIQAGNNSKSLKNEVR